MYEILDAFWNLVFRGSHNEPSGITRDEEKRDWITISVLPSFIWQKVRKTRNGTNQHNMTYARLDTVFETPNANWQVDETINKTQPIRSPIISEHFDPNQRKTC